MPTAAKYAAPTRPRSNRPRNRPVGNARKTCRKTANGTRSRASPIVFGRLGLVDARLESEVMKPAAIISGPRRLSGRRHQASRPLKM